MLSGVSALPGAAVSRTRDEVASIWHEARALSRSGQPRPEEGGPPSADRVYLAWYLGLAAMGASGLIEWRLAAVIAAAHTVERYGHRQRIREFVEGLDAGI